jgi:hypothetical protein
MNTEITKRTQDAISDDINVKIAEIADLIYEHFSNIYPGKIKTDYTSAESTEIADVLNNVGTAVKLKFWLAGKD